MNVKSSLAIAALIALPLSLFSAPYKPQQESLTTTLTQLRTSVSTLKNTVNNHESEIRTFDEKLQTQETQFETLREQLTDLTEDQKNLIKNQNIDQESRISALDGTLKSLIADMKQLKTQSNDSVVVLGQYKQTLSEINQILDAQNQQIKSLESALKYIVELAQNGDSASPKEKSGLQYNSGNTYKVQSGDTLEKIARKHNISVKSLIEMNNLSSDRIMIGQTLSIP